MHIKEISQINRTAKERSMSRAGPDEWAGFPVGWMSRAPLEMQSFRTWLRLRGLI